LFWYYLAGATVAVLTHGCENLRIVIQIYKTKSSLSFCCQRINVILQLITKVSEKDQSGWMTFLGPRLRTTSKTVWDNCLLTIHSRRYITRGEIQVYMTSVSYEFMYINYKYDFISKEFISSQCRAVLYYIFYYKK
jgi:hypothetical protein